MNEPMLLSGRDRQLLTGLICRLEERITALEAETARLKAENARLKARLEAREKGEAA